MVILRIIVNIKSMNISKKLYFLLYPFTTLAVAVNLFMLGLMGQFVGLTAISPGTALILCVPLGVPANWLVTRWVQRLMDEADGNKHD